MTPNSKFLQAVALIAALGLAACSSILDSDVGLIKAAEDQVMDKYPSASSGTFRNVHIVDSATKVTNANSTMQRTEGRFVCGKFEWPNSQILLFAYREYDKSLVTMGGGEVGKLDFPRICLS